MMLSNSALALVGLLSGFAAGAAVIANEPRVVAFDLDRPRPRFVASQPAGTVSKRAATIDVTVSNLVCSPAPVHTLI